jgi:hypothetical protein
MKPNKLAGVFLFLAVCIMALAPFASAQQKKPQLYFVEDYMVKPSMVATYEAASKDLIATVFQPYNWSWPLETYVTEDFHYYCVYPIASLTDLDKAFATFNEILGKFGEQKWDALNRKMGDASEYYKQGTFTFSPELSYIPEKPRLKPEEEKFIYWGFCYVMPGREREFEALFKKIVELCKSKKLAIQFNTFVGGIGADSPLYFYTEYGRTIADFFMTAEKTDKILGQEITDIWNKVLSLMRKYEFKTGFVRPDLSFIPTAKAK